MTNTIPESHIDILFTPVIAHLATILSDGSPQVTPVWFLYEDSYIFINSAKGRVKDRNMRRDPRVSLSMVDPEDNYRYLQVRGNVVEITEEGADDMIDRLAQKYLQVEEYPWRNPNDIRVTYRIKPSSSSTMG
jgi:PPOX class probable F420-dependent enzyme